VAGMVQWYSRQWQVRALCVKARKSGAQVRALSDSSRRDMFARADDVEMIARAGRRWRY